MSVHCLKLYNSRSNDAIKLKLYRLLAFGKFLTALNVNKISNSVESFENVIHKTAMHSCTNAIMSSY